MSTTPSNQDALSLVTITFRVGRFTVARPETAVMATEW